MMHRWGQNDIVHSISPHVTLYIGGEHPMTPKAPKPSGTQPLEIMSALVSSDAVYLWLGAAPMPSL